MNMSEQIDQISTALAKAQGEIKNPAKNSTNPHFKNKYADLTAGLDAIKDALSKNSIAVVQGTEADGDTIILHTRLLHSSGQWIGGTYPVCKMGGKHQETGSAMTYARRYALFALVGIAGDEDDDGNAAGDTAPARSRPARPDPIPTYEPEESAARRVKMVEEIEACKDRAGLHDWAQRNSAIKDRLTPPDQTIVSKAFKDRQTAIKPTGAELLAAG